MSPFDSMIKFKNDGIQRPIDKGEHHRFAIRRLKEVKCMIIMICGLKGDQSLRGWLCAKGDWGQIAS